MSDAPVRPEDAEAQAVRERYARRVRDDRRYSRLNPAALWPAQELERAVAGVLAERAGDSLAQWKITEVGCGAGANLLTLLRLGASARNLCGIELIDERLRAARSVLPVEVRLAAGDATHVDVGDATQDLVMQFTVFSSLLDAMAQQALARRMWQWLKPGGMVLWYDFTVDNPRNRDVRGVPLARVRGLFPESVLTHRRLTLAPPLARAACRLHPSLYTVLNVMPFLRTHVLAWALKR
jgi:SAM-dependent methyltransferase